MLKKTDMKQNDVEEAELSQLHQLLIEHLTSLVLASEKPVTISDVKA